MCGYKRGKELGDANSKEWLCAVTVQPVPAVPWDSLQRQDVSVVSRDFELLVGIPGGRGRGQGTS